MNCISIAFFPAEGEATVKRVVEYFYPREGQGKIWVDIFIDNPSDKDLTMNVLHEGSLCADDVTGDSWVQEQAVNDRCAGVLTKRIRELHDVYCPVIRDLDNHSVWLDGEEYLAWTGNLATVIGDNPAADVPFTLWELSPIIRNTRTVLRLRLEMHEPTYQLRFAGRGSFLAYGEAIVLRNIEDAVRSFTEADAQTFQREFCNFKVGHKVPEAFEYLIVSPDGSELQWDAVALSALISPKFIRSGLLARTTRWFATDSPYIDAWRLEGNQKGDFILKLNKTSGTPDSRVPQFAGASVRD